MEQLGVRLKTALPVIRMNRDSIRLFETNPKGQQSEKKFTISLDSTDIRCYVVRPTEAMIKGYDYLLTLPQGTFYNLDKLPNEKTEAKFKIPQSEELSLLRLSLTGVDVRYIVELTDEKGNNVIRTYQVDKGGTYDFPYLKEGKYMIRISCDMNRNGYADTGNLLERKQPETVRFYESTPGNRVLEIPGSAEIEQTIDLKEMFR